MADDRFPFGLTSRAALVELIRRSYPDIGITEALAVFGDMYSDPTPEEPGRTFVEYADKVSKHKDWYVYRRLDIAKKLAGEIILKVKTPITINSIVNEINRSKNLYLTNYDVALSDTPLPEQEVPFDITLQMLDASWVWYGQLKFTVAPIYVGANVMRWEDDTLMQLEGGPYMELETA